MPLFIGTIRNQNTKLHQWEPILPRQSYQPKIFQLSKNHISPRQDDIFIDQKYIPRYGKEKRHFWVQIELDLMDNIADFILGPSAPPIAETCLLYMGDLSSRTSFTSIFRFFYPRSVMFNNNKRYKSRLSQAKPSSSEDWLLKTLFTSCFFLAA